MKTELLENADVTVSINYLSQHALGSLGIKRGHFVHMFSDFEYHSVFVWMGIILKMLLVWTRIFFTQIKRCVFKNFRIRVDGALDKDHEVTAVKRFVHKREVTISYL